MIIEREYGVSGSYQLKIKRGSTGLTETIDFENILTDYFFLVNLTDPLLQVGTGTATPLVSDTDLQSPIANRLSGSLSVDPTIINGAGFLTKANIEVTWPIGAIVGNISEVGAFEYSIGANLLSRALIKDGSGNPTTVTVTVEDQLILTYVLSLNFMPVNENLSVVIDGILTDVSIISGGELSRWAVSPWSCHNVDYVLRSNYLVFYDPSDPVVHPASQGARFTGNNNTNFVDVKTKDLSYGSGQKSVTITHSAQASQLNDYPSVNQALIAVEGSYGVAYGALLFEFSPAISKTNQKSFTLSYKITMTRA